MQIENRIANAFGYEYGVLFPNARSAIAHFVEELNYRGQIPSNVCPELATAMKHYEPVPVDSHCGLAWGVPVQLYGYRQAVNGMKLEIDPLMTGYFGKPYCENSIISFGRHKTLDINAGGAFLTNNIALAGLMATHAYFPEHLRTHLQSAFSFFYSNVESRREAAEIWDRFLGDLLIRIPQEQIIPWRVIRRVPDGKRDEVVKRLRLIGIPVGTNYPPLSGIKNKQAKQWGDEVINFWTTIEKESIPKACEAIETVMWTRDRDNS